MSLFIIMAFKRRRSYRRRRLGVRRRSSRVRRARRVYRRGRRMTSVAPMYPRAAFTLPSMNNRRRSRISGRKRTRFSASTTQNKRQRYQDTAGYNQWVRYGFSKKLARYTMRKQVRALTQTRDYIWRNLIKLAGNGAMFMSNYYTGVGTARVIRRPIYLVDLTSTITQAGSGIPVFTLDRRAIGANPSYALTPVSGYTPSGTLSSTWNALNVPAVQAVAEKALLHWSEIRLDLWGAQQRPCEYTLTLCQFDDRLLPDGDNGSLNITDNEAIEWWDSLSGKLIQNPNLRKPPPGIGPNMLKVIDRRMFMINPISTTEADQDPHCKTVRLFYRHNRLVNFCWSNTSKFTYPDETDAAAEITFAANTPATMFTTAQPKARIYLMVTCANFRGTQSGSAESKIDTGSINMQVTTRWTDV